MISLARVAALHSALLALAACASPPLPEAQKPPAAVGAVQREIKVGMGQPEVIAALGTPDTISNDTQQREVWTYDKVPSDRVDTSKSVGGGITVSTGGVSPATPASSPANPRTLTLNIYYDEQKRVREIAYNYSPPPIQPSAE